MNTLMTALSSTPVSPVITTTANSAEPKMEPITIKDFNTTQQATLFKNLKQNQFSGQVIFWDQRGVMSIFHLFYGRLVFVTGGDHPIRRWIRNLRLHCPTIASELDVTDREIYLPKIEEISEQYQLLSRWVKEQKINREQVSNLIRGLFTEILFDLTQSKQITYVLQPSKSSSTPLILINPEEIIVEVWKLWLDWQKANFSNYFPNLAPIISKPEQLEAQTLPAIYKLLMQYLDGETSLRDLAVQLKQDNLSLMRSLSTYLQWGLIKFREIEDLSNPTIPKSVALAPSNSVKKNLVVYIDDNLNLCQRMKDILIPAGYRCITVQNELEAIAICLEQNPDIIVINAQDSNTFTYNLCQQLRQLSFFHHTPIIVLADQVSLKNRIIAKVTKISIMSANLDDSEIILSTLSKSLSQKFPNDR